MTTQPLKLVGASEIETRFGLNRMQIYRLMQSGDFPPPAAELKGGRVWNEAEVAVKIEQLREAGRINSAGYVVPWRFLADGHKPADKPE